MSLGAAAGAAAGGIAGLAGQFIGSKSQEKINEANINAAKGMWEDQKRVQMFYSNRAIQQANTVYQRKVNDLKAAGLNPMLALGGQPSPAMGGGGPSSPNIPKQESPAGTGAAVGQAMASSAQEAARYLREVKATNAQVDLNKAAKKKAEKEGLQAVANTRQVDELTKQIRARTPAILEHGKIDKKAATLDAIKKRIPFGSIIYGGAGKKNKYGPMGRGRR